MKTREYNEQHIKNGGSVLWKGKIITDINELPTDAKIAEMDESRSVEVAAKKKADAAAKLAHAEELEALKADADRANELANKTQAENEALREELEALKAAKADASVPQHDGGAAPTNAQQETIEAAGKKK